MEPKLIFFYLPSKFSVTFFVYFFGLNYTKNYISVYYTTLHYIYLCLITFYLQIISFLLTSFLGALAVDMKNVYPKEIVKLPCPLLEHAIQSGDYRELPWKVADLRDISESERELGYCDENLTCTRYSSLGNLKKRITIRNAVLWVQQWIEDDLLTFTCPVQRKQNKEPLVYKVNFYSSVICE